MPYNFTPKPRTVFDQTNEAQVQNSDGAYVYNASDEKLLDRFLVLGTMTNTYYDKAETNTRAALDALKRLIQGNPFLVVNRIADVNRDNKAMKHSNVLAASAAVMAFGSPDARKAMAYELKNVLRTGSHLLEFVKYVTEFGRGWGRGLRNVVTSWFHSQNSEGLAYQVAKYQQRNGWSMRDLLRLAHPKMDGAKQSVARWVTKGEVSEDMPDILKGVEAAKAEKSAWNVAHIVREYGLSREMIPTQYLTDKAVMIALLETMPITAMLRTLNLYAAADLHTDASVVEHTIKRITDEQVLKNGRVHPMSIFLALAVYASGHGARGGKTWTPNKAIVQALQTAFEKSFSYTEPVIDGRTLVALDYSGSMTSTYVDEAGIISAAMAGGAFAYIVWRLNPSQTRVVGFSDWLDEINTRGVETLGQFMSRINERAAGTNMGLPFQWAEQEKEKFDAILFLTDEHVNMGYSVEDLAKRYRSNTGKKTAVIMATCAVNAYTVNAPSDPLSFNIPAFTPDLPNVVSYFVREAQG
jgi:60 kDa SS-A/Ro ribonucleoprotein